MGVAGAKAQRLGQCQGDTEAEAIADACREYGVTAEADKKRIILRGE
jgi:hypothetical protein